MAGRGRRAPRRSSRSGGEQLDVTAFPATPVRVGRNGRARQMSAFEVGLRAQVKAAIKEQSIRAIRSLIALAVKYELSSRRPHRRRSRAWWSISPGQTPPTTASTRTNGS